MTRLLVCIIGKHNICCYIYCSEY